MNEFVTAWGVYMLKNAARYPQWADAYHHDAYAQAMHVMALEANSIDLGRSPVDIEAVGSMMRERRPNTH